MNYRSLQHIATSLWIFSLQDIRMHEPGFLLNNIVYRKKKWYIKQISRGWYIESTVNINESVLYTVATKIYALCYVSMESALRYYNLIPEWVFLTTACATKKTQRLSGDIGFFVF